MRKYKPKTVTVNPVGALPVVMFTNTSYSPPARHAFVCTTVEVAKAEAEDLRSLDHITDVEVGNAVVKGLK